MQITVDLLSGWIENATTPLLYIKCNRIFLLSWVLIKEKERRPLKIIIAKVSNGDKRFCDSRGWSHKKAWSSLRASSGRSCPSCVNAHESYVRELNRGNVCVVAGKRKSWVWFNLNVHLPPSIHCLDLFMHVKSTRQWKSSPLYLACMAGVRKGTARKLVRSTTREGGGRRVPFLSPSRAPHALARPNSPFPF